eukprot:214645-Prymnesium_polylepis.1
MQAPMGLGALIAAGPPPGHSRAKPAQAASSHETVSSAPPAKQNSEATGSLEFATLDRAAAPRKRKPATRKHASSTG